MCNAHCAPDPHTATSFSSFRTLLNHLPLPSSLSTFISPLSSSSHLSFTPDVIFSHVTLDLLFLFFPFIILITTTAWNNLSYVCDCLFCSCLYYWSPYIGLSTCWKKSIHLACLPFHPQCLKQCLSHGNFQHHYLNRWIHMHTHIHTPWSFYYTLRKLNKLYNI